MFQEKCAIYIFTETVSSYRYRYRVWLFQNDLFISSRSPAFFSDVCRGCPKQPDKQETFKGAYLVCAVLSKSQKDNELQSALPMEKCTA